MNYLLRPLQSVEEYLLFFKKRQILNRRFTRESKLISIELEIDHFDLQSSHFGLFRMLHNRQLPLAFARLTEVRTGEKVIPDHKPTAIHLKCLEAQKSATSLAKLPVFEHFEMDDQDLLMALETTTENLHYLEAGRLLVSEESLPISLITDFIVYIISIASYYDFEFLLTSVSESHSGFYSNFFGTNTIIKTQHNFAVPMVMSVFDLKKKFKRKAELSDQMHKIFRTQGIATGLLLSNNKILT